MRRSLELLLEGESNCSYSSPNHDDYRSKSERFIAEFLRKQGIRFVYEDPLYIEFIKKGDKKEKGQLWHPDFHLQDLGVIVEYMGQYHGESDEQYKKRTESKKEIYEKNNIKVVYLTRDDIWDKSKNFKKPKPDAERIILEKIYKVISSNGAYPLESLLISAKAPPHQQYHGKVRYAA